jgi:tRNA U38,U39,U40 pseudouridine synthase TruA
MNIFYQQKFYFEKVFLNILKKKVKNFFIINKYYKKNKDINKKIEKEEQEINESENEIIINEEEEKKNILKELNRLLSKFEGTKAYHNYTNDVLKPTDKECERFIMKAKVFIKNLFKI